MQPLNQPLQAPPIDFAISSSNNNTYTFRRQDVPHGLVNASSTAHPPNKTSTDYNELSSPTVSASPSHHVPLNSNKQSLRTSNQVFSNTYDLAAHYGIPQFLPPAPRTTPRRQSQHEYTHIDTSPTSPVADFESMRSNYLNMLNQKPDEHAVADEASTTMVSASDIEPSIQALVDTLKASPEFQTYSDFLTSPFDDSPLDDFLTTPDMSGDGFDFMTSPAIVDSVGDSFNFGDMPLFGNGGVDMDMDDSKSAIEAPKPAQSIHSDFDNLLTISPDDSPSLDPSSLFPSEMPTTPARRKMATGTRKNITLNSLVPLDAPTQTRTYVTPSATSRKDVPAVFARKRARSQAFGDEEDQLEEITLPLNPTEAQLIEAKRRQNTIAARRSRQRKLEYTRHLEDKVDTLTEEKEMWKARAVTCEALLKSHGLTVPEQS